VVLEDPSRVRGHAGCRCVQHSRPLADDTTVLSTSISYTAAWSAWFHHVNIGADYLWHVPMYWWGRVGLFLQLVSGVTVVTSIIGTDVLKRWTAKLSGSGFKSAADDVWR
jgi:hypothetical protein